MCCGRLSFDSLLLMYFEEFSTPYLWRSLTLARIAARAEKFSPGRRQNSVGYLKMLASK